MNIFLDAHGVLIDLVTGLKKSTNRRKLEWVPGEYDLTGPFGMKILDFMGRASFWWWASLPRTQECSSIVEACLEYSDTVRVCTAAHTPMAVMGTLLWVQREFGFPVIYAEDKYLLARDKNDVLIDDCDQNIHLWRAAGGTGILVPRIWNSAHADTRPAADVIEEALRACSGRV